MKKVFGEYVGLDEVSYDGFYLVDGDIIISFTDENSGETFDPVGATINDLVGLSEEEIAAEKFEFYEGLLSGKTYWEVGKNSITVYNGLEREITLWFDGSNGHESIEIGAGKTTEIELAEGVKVGREQDDTFYCEGEEAFYNKVEHCHTGADVEIYAPGK